MNDTNATAVHMRALDAWVNQRPGLDPANYFGSGDWTENRRNYDRERASILRDLHEYRAIAGAVRWRTFTDAQWQEAFRAFSGRLTATRAGDAVRLDYCTGQYWPTEYRRAACAVLAALLWADKRESVPADTAAPGTVIRSQFAREFGRTIAARWFS